MDGASSGAAAQAADELVERARSAIDSVELDLAWQFYERALALVPNDAAIIDEAAELLLRMCQQEKARELLVRSVEVAPDASAGKYLDLAQLSDGQEALKMYKKAQKLLRRDLARAKRRAKSDDGAQADAAALQRQLCTSFVSVGELYMTDLCYEAGAEAACETALEQATAKDTDYGGPEPPQAMANLRLCQQRPQEAVPLAKEAFRRLGRCEPQPESEFRVSTAKLLLECSDVQQDCVEDALEVLSGLMREDDENVEVWYLMGTAFYRQDPPDLALAYQHLTGAAELLAKRAKEAKKAGEELDGEEQARLVAEQLQLVKDAEKDGLGKIFEENSENSDAEVEEGSADAEEAEMVDANER